MKARSGFLWMLALAGLLLLGQMLVHGLRRDGDQSRRINHMRQMADLAQHRAALIIGRARAEADSLRRELEAARRPTMTNLTSTRAKVDSLYLLVPDGLRPMVAEIRDSLGSLAAQIVAERAAADLALGQAALRYDELVGVLGDAQRRIHDLGEEAARAAAKWSFGCTVGPGVVVGWGATVGTTVSQGVTLAAGAGINCGVTRRFRINLPGPF